MYIHNLIGTREQTWLAIVYTVKKQVRHLAEAVFSIPPIELQVTVLDRLRQDPEDGVRLGGGWVE